MNKEEAIEYLKNLIKNPTISQDPFYTTKIAIDTVLNYIEELEKKSKKCEYFEEVADVLYKDSINKQKIRDKIEILERLQKNFPKNEELKTKAMVLKELLEE